MLLVVQSLSNFCRRGSAVDHMSPILDISIRSGDIRDRILKLLDVDPNFARFWPRLFLGWGSTFFDRDYKIEHNTEYVANFEGDWPREVGDLALKKERKKGNWSKTYDRRELPFRAAELEFVEFVCMHRIL